MRSSFLSRREKGMRFRFFSPREKQETQAIRSSPPMYGRSTSGTVIEPSAFW